MQREGTNLLIHSSKKIKDEEKHACDTFYGQHVQPAKKSKLWIKRITKQSSKNKSKDEENVHIFQNEVLNMDEKHLELNLAIWIKVLS